MPDHPRDIIYLETEAERLTQDKKWGRQDHDDGFWSLILGEEFGEVCRAALEQESHLREELIQVAAVATAWVEAIDRRSA